MRILVVEDEEKLASILSDILVENGYQPSVANNGVAGLDEGLSGVYDAVVLDVMLPGMNGFELVKRLRAEGVSTPVLMLTARTETSDKVRGLDSGADYYLTKPFEMEEFLACLRALLRRPNEVVMDELCFCDIALVPASLLLRCRDQSIRLSSREFELMRMLILQKGGIIKKETILLKLWGYEADVEESNVEVYISFLRKKLVRIGAGAEIRSVRRAGYYLNAGDRA